MVARFAGASLGGALLVIGGIARAEPPNVQITAAYDDTCARKIDGTTWCWGFNGLSELGNGSTSDSAVPVAVLGVGSGVVEVSAGQYHTCARRSDGSVWCWGYDIDGELGNDTTNGSFNAVPVALGGSAIQVSTGYFHACAVLSDASAWCWGRNDYGQTGDASSANDPVPFRVASLGNNVAAVSAGADATCARKVDGTVWCWGNNSLGQLGTAGPTSSASPVQVTGIVNAVEVSANNQFGCARKVDGTVWCWGGNTDGELGIGSHGNASAAPLPVTGLVGPAAQISAGDDGACAVMANGSLWCWGSNFHGNVGDGTLIPRYSPVQVAALGFAVAEVSMGVHTCARAISGDVYCWGYNSNGQLGTGSPDGGTPADSWTPALVPIQTAAAPAPAPAVSRRASVLLALTLLLSGLYVVAPRRRSPRSAALDADDD